MPAATVWPDFLIVGAPKCGTTALYRYLSEHTAIFMPRVKEPHFFAPDLYTSNYVRDEVEYLELFAEGSSGEHVARGEASVCYLYSSVAIGRIRETIPHARIVAMFRNPVDLFVSLHNQALAGLFEDEPDPERAWCLQADRAQGRSLPRLCENPKFLAYGDFCSLGAQFQRLLDEFPREQVHTVVFEDLARDPGDVYRGVLRFLGVPDDERSDFSRVNESYRFRRQWLRAAHIRLDRAVRNMAWLRRRRGLMRRLRPISQFISRQNVERSEKPTLRPEFRAQLEEYFAPDVDLLSRLLGRDLSHWCRTEGSTAATESG